LRWKNFSNSKTKTNLKKISDTYKKTTNSHPKTKRKA